MVSGGSGRPFGGLGGVGGDGGRLQAQAKCATSGTIPPAQCSPPPSPPVSAVCRAAVSVLSGAPQVALPQKTATFSPPTAVRHTARCAVTAQPPKSPPRASVVRLLTVCGIFSPRCQPPPRSAWAEMFHVKHCFAYGCICNYCICNLFTVYHPREYVPRHQPFVGG